MTDVFEIASTLVITFEAGCELFGRVGPIRRIMTAHDLHQRRKRVLAKRRKARHHHTEG